ncbi:hypothetical protein [Microtetraspora malaysiensis]|uniref:hypothetical protein n=1 Tax=Microtetraspora malaysiensis TaxID=161358 RepID=UPI003D902165
MRTGERRRLATIFLWALVWSLNAYEWIGRVCADLAAEMRAARTSASGPERALADVAAGYAAFAERRPALYDVMFNQAVSLPFATPEAPDALHGAFDELPASLGFRFGPRSLPCRSLDPGGRLRTAHYADSVGRPASIQSWMPSRYLRTLV